ncbi:ABC transporter ATP-binding protein [Stomatohabitans albus]|uniref:ABC transporter ATP-binding protein n=1 Tax=Stomatohabitans albus TaxID=3110766 RepID=UPI00300CC482
MSEEPDQVLSEEEQAEIARTSTRLTERGPGMGQKVVEKPAAFGPSLKRLLHTLAPQRRRLVLVIVLAIISVSLSVVIPKLLGSATDVFVAGSQSPDGINLRMLGFYLILAATCAILSWLSGTGQGWVLSTATHQAVHDLRLDVSEKLERLPLSYFDQQPRGELLSRITNDIDNISQSLQQTLQQILTSLLTIIGVMGMMLFVSPLLAMISVLIVPLSGIVAMQIGKVSQHRFALMWKHTGELNSVVEESITGHMLVKGFGRVPEQQAVFDEANNALFRSSASAQWLSGIMHPVMFFIGNLNYVLIAIIGAYRVINGQLNIGDVQAFFHYSRQFTQPITQVASMANVLQSGVASAERIFQILDQEEIRRTPNLPVPPTRGRVEMRHVDFAYTPDKPLITDLNLTVEPGQTVAIVGPTGAGKTTLVNLLMRFYEINGGKILVDGADIAELSRAEHRRRIGMVLQDAWIFSGTIRANIAYGRLNSSEDEIRTAAKAALADRFIATLPDGYDTVIEDNGENLSAGERQLLTIARAFLAQPSMLILDEATSNVDTRTEVMIQEAMNRLRAGRTSFVIAHRLSTIRNADVIVVMDNGHIVEIGAHDELMAAKGRYYELNQSAYGNA